MDFQTRFFQLKAAVILLLILSSLLLFSTSSSCEYADLVWMAQHDGPSHKSDYGYAVALGKHGDVYVAGGARTLTAMDEIVIIKYDSEGAELWIAEYNDEGSYDYGPYAIAVDRHDNVIVTGYAYGENLYDWITLKYSRDGKLLWTKRYNGPGMDTPYAIAVDRRGNIYVSGYTHTGDPDGAIGSATTIKYDPAGNELWIARYDEGGSSQSAVLAMALDVDDNVVVTGSLVDEGRSYFLTLKYGRAGKQLWEEKYISPDGWQADGRSVAFDTKGNVYIAGLIGSRTVAEWYFVTIKYNRHGKTKWVRRHRAGDSYGYPPWVNGIAVYADRNIYVAGREKGSTGFDYSLVKYDFQGNELWAKKYDHEESPYDITNAMTMDSRGNVYLTGSSMDSVYCRRIVTVKYNSSGDLKWVAPFEMPNCSGAMPRGMAMDGDRDIYIAGIGSGDNFEDIITIKYSQRR